MENKKKRRPKGMTYNTSGLPKKRPKNLIYVKSGNPRKPRVETKPRKKRCPNKIPTYARCFLCEKKRNMSSCLLLKWNKSFFTLCIFCNKKFRLIPKKLKR